MVRRRRRRVTRNLGPPTVLLIEYVHPGSGIHNMHRIHQIHKIRKIHKIQFYRPCNHIQHYSIYTYNSTTANRANTVTTANTTYTTNTSPHCTFLTKVKVARSVIRLNTIETASLKNFPRVATNHQPLTREKMRGKI